MKRGLLYLLTAALFLAGLVMIFYPAGHAYLTALQNNKLIGEFQQKELEPQTDGKENNETSGDNSEEKEPSKDTGEEVVDEKSLFQLQADMQDYNQQIFENDQKELCDAWSYTQNIFDFQAAGLADDMVGYLTIDAMDLELPLFIGANEEHMSRGAAVLSQTSMPVGGENTNCVIAAHRGWKGIPMFREIERLAPGDQIKITNLWETLTYQVVKSIVIYPDDIDAVKIQEGEDLVTLITCHPYTKNYQRYVVYCSRVETPETDISSTESQESVKDIPDIPFEGVAYESSQNDIQRELAADRAGLLLAKAAVLLIFILLLAATCRKIRRKYRKRFADKSSKPRE